MAEMDEKLRKMADEALAKSGADVTISEDGTVSGSPVEYFKFLDAFIPEDAANDPINELIKILARKTAQEYAAVKVEGLVYRADFITPEEEAKLIAQIDAQPWLTDLKRRVQHYGYKYDYKARAVGADAWLGPLPDWLQPLCRRLHEEQIFAEMPDQVIVNEYQPGQGISAHVDCVPCFGDTVASLSLGSACAMVFSHPEVEWEKGFYLKERSLIVLSGPARYEWKHAIPARKSDVINEQKIPRGRRISLTFRKVIRS